MRVIAGSQRTTDSDTFSGGCRGKVENVSLVCMEERNNSIPLIDILSLYDNYFGIIFSHHGPTQSNCGN